MEVKGDLFCVFADWNTEPLEADRLAGYLVQLFARESGCCGLLIAGHGFTASAIDEARRAATYRRLILCDLREIVAVLENGGHLGQWLMDKVTEAGRVGNINFFPPIRPAWSPME